MSCQPRSTASSCVNAAARSSGVNVLSEVRSSHLPSRWASHLAAPWSMRSSPTLVRRRYRRRPGLVFSEPTSSSRLRAVQVSEPLMRCCRWAIRLARTVASLLGEGAAHRCLARRHQSHEQDAGHHASLVSSGRDGAGLVVLSMGPPRR